MHFHGVIMSWTSCAGKFEFCTATVVGKRYTNILFGTTLNSVVVTLVSYRISKFCVQQNEMAAEVGRERQIAL